jgi:hypothetical protein
MKWFTMKCFFLAIVKEYRPLLVVKLVIVGLIVTQNNIDLMIIGKSSFDNNIYALMQH